MKRVIAAVVLAVLLLPTSVLSASASPPAEVDPGASAPGGPVNLTGSGFTPGETVSAFFDGTMTTTGVAAADGSVELHARVPADAAPGTHWITLIGNASHAWNQERIAVSLPVSTDVLSVRRADGSAWTPIERAGLTPGSVDDLQRVWSTSLDRTEEGATYPESSWGGPTYGQETSVWGMLDGTAYAIWHASYRRDDGTDHERTVVAAIDVTTGGITWERTFDAFDPAPASFIVVGGHPSTLILSLDGWPGRLLGIDALTGSTRWSLKANPIVASDGDVVIAPVFDPSVGVGVFAIDPSTGEARWQLATERVRDIGEEAAMGAGVVALERMVRPGIWSVVTFETTGEERWSWTRRTGTNYGLVMTADRVMSGSGTYQPNAGGRITALDLATGETAWRWDYPRKNARTWVWADPIGATAESLLVQAARCNQLEACDGTVELVALSVEDGRKLWTHALDEPTGPIAIAGDVIAIDGGRVLLDADTGETLGTIDLNFQVQPYPVHPAAPVLVDGRMLTTSMDSVVLFEARVRADRPDVDGLVAKLARPTPSATTSAGPALLLVVFILGAVGVYLVSSLRRGRPR